MLLMALWGFSLTTTLDKRPYSWPHALRFARPPWISMPLLPHCHSVDYHLFSTSPRSDNLGLSLPACDVRAY